MIFNAFLCQIKLFFKENETDKNKRSSCSSRLIKYLNNYWNFIDIAGCTLFLIGISLRFISLMTIDENIFDYARLELFLLLILNLN